MPTYEYQCIKCGYKFEEIQRITAPPLESCPQNGCDGKVRRLIGTGGGLLFKGSGFYITDYRSEGYKKAAKSENDSSGSSSNGKKGEKPATESKSNAAAENKE